MNVNTLIVGALETNCYILTKDNKSIIIDPGDEADYIISNINTQVVGIIITHNHEDHIGALKPLVDYYKVKSYDIYNMNEGIFSIDNFTFEVIITKGHKDDSISIYFKEEKIMFTGDFIFKSSIGRMDLEGGSPSSMKSSIAHILKYDDDITIYPGHGVKTSLGNERRNLEYFMNII